VAPDLLFHPVFDEAEARTGVPDRKVVDPAAQHRVDQLDHPIHRLRLVASEHVPLAKPETAAVAAQDAQAWPVARCHHWLARTLAGVRAPLGRAFTRRTLSPFRLLKIKEATCRTAKGASPRSTDAEVAAEHVICAPIEKLDRKLRAGDWVHARFTRLGLTSEFVREVVVRDGQLSLTPLVADPELQDLPIGGEVELRGSC
jgi:hypothetical protein